MAYSAEEAYSLSITVGSDQIGLNLKAFDIYISDSIYRLCPQVTFITDDISGIAFESRLGILGQEIAFTINDTHSTVTYPLTCIVYETPETKSANGLSGVLKLQFSHTAKFSLKQPKCYDNKTPADAFKDLISNMNQTFNAFANNKMNSPTVNVDKTTACVSYPLIYNPGYDNEEFLNKILLPLAANGEPNTTPYFAYINAENKAYFESLKDISEKSPIKTLVFGKSIDNIDNAAVIFTLQSFSQEYNKVSNFVDESFTFFNREQEIESQDTSLKKVFNPLAMMRKSSSMTLLSPEKYDHVIDANEEYAKNNYEKRKGILFDKLYVLTIMDLELSAGKTVNVETYMNINADEKAESYSGKFIIESAEHIWNSSQLTGYTRLVLGRASMEVKGKEMYS